MILEINGMIIRKDSILYVLREDNALVIGTPLREIAIDVSDKQMEHFYNSIKDFIGK